MNKSVIENSVKLLSVLAAVAAVHASAFAQVGQVYLCNGQYDSFKIVVNDGGVSFVTNKSQNNYSVELTADAETQSADQFVSYKGEISGCPSNPSGASCQHGPSVMSIEVGQSLLDGAPSGQVIYGYGNKTIDCEAQ